MIDFMPRHPEQFTIGMAVRKEPNLSRSNLPITIKPYTGKCQNGLHFGSLCFDRISTWWTEVKETG